MSAYTDVFLGILLFSFGLFTLLAGIFTAYFGAGRSRAIGFILMIVGVVGILAFASLTWDLVPTIAPIWDNEAIKVSLIGVLGSAIGAIGALIVFLISIMKA